MRTWRGVINDHRYLLSSAFLGGLRCLSEISLGDRREEDQKEKGASSTLAQLRVSAVAERTREHESG